MDGWMDRQMHGWMDGWMGGWMGGLMDGWMHGWVYIFSTYNFRGSATVEVPVRRFKSDAEPSISIKRGDRAQRGCAAPDNL